MLKSLDMEALPGVVPAEVGAAAPVVPGASYQKRQGGAGGRRVKTDA